jgi:hypothetical protein
MKKTRQPEDSQNPMKQTDALGKPKARKPQRLGFMKGKLSVPDDFDTMFSAEIEEMFCGKE